MNDNIKTEQKKEMTVGEILRNARTTGRRKREIQTISKQLCIREEFLQALEDGKYEAIPETVYMLGFARNYAMELGLDPEEIVNKLKHEMGLDKKDEEEENVIDEVIKEDIKDKNINADILDKIFRFIRRNWLWFTIGLSAIVIIIVVMAVMFTQKTDNDGMTVNSSDSGIVQVNKFVEPKYTVTVRDRFGTENAETASIILQAVQESWVKIEDARGNTLFSRVLVPGDIYYVPNGNGYKAVFGNAGGMDVWVNGVLIPKLGANHVRVGNISMDPDKLVPSAVAAE